MPQGRSARNSLLKNVSIVLIACLIIVVGWFAYSIWSSSSDSNQVIVKIPAGASFAEVLDTLTEAGLVSNSIAFRLLAVTTGSDGKIRPGTYKFTRGISNAALLNALVEGRSSVRMKVTFPEGITIRRMAAILTREIGVDSAAFVRLANDRKFLETIGINASTAEGYLMPDTYFLYWGEQPETVLARMSETFRAFYTDNLKKLAAAQGLTPYEAIILASIVEGEARTEGDRPIIAGLYLNRLRRGMKLEADPTIQYVLPDGPRRLLYKDLEMDNPYNSYRYKGLPPTPINNPGRASITATLKPASHGYLYMVAKADGSGQHTFSRTGAEHEQAVKLYRKRVGTE